MGRQSSGRRRILRAVLLLVALAALVLSPLVIAMTHGPAKVAEMSETLAHGHSHAEPGPGMFDGHDAADHEHQFQGLFPDWEHGVASLSETRGKLDDFDLNGLTRDGPRRPPRLL